MTELRYEYITCSFLINEYRITEYFCDERNYLNATFETRRIRRGRPVLRPLRSPYFFSTYYFLWGHICRILFIYLHDLDEDLVFRVSENAESVCETPGILQHIRLLHFPFYQACIATSGRNFDQLF
ncbi:uncharacterized protein TNCV_4934501 [Trichonephila clavipes]|nr:uncharacterized protein TNCV_4934501 [Trichonephila clavipes]